MCGNSIVVLTNERVVEVGISGLQEDNGHTRILAEPIGKHASGDLAQMVEYYPAHEGDYERRAPRHLGNHKTLKQYSSF